MASEQILNELETIRATHGGILRAEDVVSFAEDENTALHRCFQWDDSKAARLYRLNQARGIIRVAVNVLETSKGPVETRAFVSLTPDRKEGGGYRAMADILSNQDLERRMIADALKELEVFRKKYQELSALKDLFIAIDALTEMSEAA